MNIYDFYGFGDTTISAIVEKLEKILQAKFMACESDYMGEHYIAKSYNPKALKMEKYNVYYNNIGNEEWQEEDFKEYEIILCATCPQDPNKLLDSILNCFSNCKPLRRSEILPEISIRTYVYKNNKFELQEETDLRNKKRRY
jgi:hypothetical protein